MFLVKQSIARTLNYNLPVYSSDDHHAPFHGNGHGHSSLIDIVSACESFSKSSSISVTFVTHTHGTFGAELQRLSTKKRFASLTTAGNGVYCMQHEYDSQYSDKRDAE